MSTVHPWISVKVRLPNADEYPVWGYGMMAQKPIFCEKEFDLTNGCARGIYWSRAERPAPPVKTPEDADEEAANESAEKNVKYEWGQLTNYVNGYLAGLGDLRQKLKPVIERVLVIGPQHQEYRAEAKRELAKLLS